MRDEVGLVGLGARVEMLAHLLGRSGRRSVLWPGPKGAMSAEQIREARARLKGLGVKVVNGPDAVASRTRLIALALPASLMREASSTLGDHLQGYHRLVHTMHGLEPSSGKRGSEILQEETPVRQLGALVGPLFTAAHLDEKPGAALVGSSFPALISDVQGALSSGMFRLYGNGDLVGVEIAGATADLVAVAIGVADALDLGPSIRGTLCARGVAEMARLGVALGGTERTFAGMAGLGYLVAQTSGEGREAYQAGRALASGKTPAALLEQFGPQIEELIQTSEAIVAHATESRIEAHISTQVHMMLTGAGTTSDALRGLLSLSQMME